MEGNPKLHRLKQLSILMDSQFSGPFGIKFGLDGILGLIPIAGDFITSFISLYIVLQAALFGCGPSVILRMGLNILIENIFDVLPVVGNFFDFMWKANNKNILLIEQHLSNPMTTSLKSRLTLGLVAFVLLAILIGSVALTIYLFKSLFYWLALFSS
jgi:hypothetical protein